MFAHVHVPAPTLTPLRHDGKPGSPAGCAKPCSASRAAAYPSMSTCTPATIRSTNPTAEAIDFTMMYATHDAFRRDLGRFTAASAADTADAPGVGAGWENFKVQLLLHHSVEDTDLWPRVRCAAAGQPVGLAVPDEMEAEHAQIDPLLAAVDDALADSANNLAARVAELASALEWHLKHEEAAALPLIQSVCMPADWRASSARCAVARASRARPSTSVDPRRRCTRRPTAVPGRAARPGPGDQPTPLGAALPPAGPVESLTAAAARNTGSGRRLRLVPPGHQQANREGSPIMPVSAAAGGLRLAGHRGASARTATRPVLPRRPSGPRCSR